MSRSSLSQDSLYISMILGLIKVAPQNLNPSHLKTQRSTISVNKLYISDFHVLLF